MLQCKFSVSQILRRRTLVRKFLNLVDIFHVHDIAACFLIDKLFYIFTEKNQRLFTDVISSMPVMPFSL